MARFGGPPDRVQSADSSRELGATLRRIPKDYDLSDIEWKGVESPQAVVNRVLRQARAKRWRRPRFAGPIAKFMGETAAKLGGVLDG